MKRFFTILVAFFLTFTVNAQFNQDLLNMLPHLNADSIGKTSKIWKILAIDIVTMVTEIKM